jgi:TfoX/Sxy family transcriptional regulator of competence genes
VVFACLAARFQPVARLSVGCGGLLVPVEAVVTKYDTTVGNRPTETIPMALSNVAEAIRASFASVAPGGPGGVERKMFGYPACFLNGNMYMGLHELGFVFKLRPQDRDDALRAGAMPFAPMAGRVMKEFVVWNDASLPSDPELRGWVAKAYDYAASLPAKEVKPRKRKG